MERTLTMLNGMDLDKNEKRQLRLDRIEAATVIAADAAVAPAP
jgi:hypothetical protein